MENEIIEEINGAAKHEKDQENRELPIGEAAKNWARDQRENEYYYDDAHGYEIYKPEDEESEKSEMRSEK